MATASTDSGGNGGQANSNNGADANASTTGTSNADNLQKIKLRQLATKAKGHFDQGKYDDCIGVLKSIVKDLVEKGEGGLKASHNIALCEYHIRSKNIENKENSAHFFLKELSKLKKEAAKESLSGLDACTNNGSESTDEALTDPSDGVNADGPKVEENGADSNNNSNRTEHAGNAEAGGATSGEIDDDELAGDPLVSMLMLNQAIVLIKMKRTMLAMKTLESLFSNIMLLEEPLALRTCTLLLEVYINLFRGSQNINGRMTEMQSSAAKVIEYLEKIAEDMAEADANTTKNKDTSGNAQGNNNAQDNSENGNDSKSKSALSPLSIVFHFRLRLYKAQFELIRCNISKAKKEIKSALEIYQKQLKDLPAGSTGEVPLPDNTTGLFLKANLEYLRSNYKKSIKLLNSCSDANTQASAIYLNNMGCIHFSTGRYRTAALYFSKALSAGADLSTSSDIMYNTGVQLLLSGENLSVAFQCFVEASKYQKHRPHLWLRIAECCMIENEKLQNKAESEAFVTASHSATLNDESENLPNFKNDVVDSVVGHGDSNPRRILLPKIRRKKTSGVPARGKDGEMSMEFAIACLKNVLLLTDKNGLINSNTGKVKGEEDSKDNSTDNIEPSESGEVEASDGGNDKAVALSQKRMLVLRQSALVGLGYCGLVIGNPTLALSATDELLSSTSCSAGHKLLGRTYAAEALCMLKRPDEALEHVTEAFKKDSSEGQENDGIFRSQSCALPSTIANNPFSAEARAALCVNVAAVRLQMGDLQDAETALNRALALDPSSSEILRAFVYLRLKQGNHRGALLLLKQRRAPRPNQP